MKTVTKRILSYVVCFSASYICCSLPSDIEPAKWSVNMELPITDKRHGVRDLISESVGGDMELYFGNDDSVSDTLSFIKRDSLSYSIERPLVSSDTSVVQETLGALRLANTPAVDVVFTLMVDHTEEFDGQSLPRSIPVDHSKDESLGSLHSVTFDEACPDLSVTITNTSQQADIRGIRISLLDGGDTIGRVDKRSIDARSSAEVSVPVAGETMRDPVTIAVRCTIPEGSIIEKGDGLGIKFTLDDLIASAAELSDSMINYSEVFTGEFGIADSIRLKAIDLTDAYMQFEIQNPTMLRIGLTGVIEDAWDATFAQDNSYESVEQTSSITDSSYFAGIVLDDTVSRTPEEIHYSKRLLLNDIRAFPTWSTDSAKSLLKYQYRVRSLPDGRVVRFNKNDVIVFRLVPEQFPFIRIHGEFIETMNESFQEQQDVGFEWESAILDSLKRSFRFESALMSLQFTPKLSTGSLIDCLDIHMEINDLAYSDQTITADEQFTGVSPDSLYQTHMDMACLLNNWPETLGFDGYIAIPKGSEIILHNEQNERGEYRSALSIGMDLTWTLKIPFSWQVLDTIRTALEMSTFFIDEEGLEWTQKIENRRITLSLDVYNNTNLHAVIHAVGAGEGHEDELMAYPESLAYAGETSSEWPNVFSLCGADGLRVAPRMTRSESQMLLEENALGPLFSGEEISIRWFLTMPRCNSDALTDTDYLDLKAKAVIEG
ncbi:MAG: hypothetical protein ACOC4C_05235, partial [Fibrobacterota bacterium]